MGEPCTLKPRPRNTAHYGLKAQTEEVNRRDWKSGEDRGHTIPGRLLNIFNSYSEPQSRNKNPCTHAHTQRRQLVAVLSRPRRLARMVFYEARCHVVDWVHSRRLATHGVLRGALPRGGLGPLQTPCHARSSTRDAATSWTESTSSCVRRRS